MVSLVNSHTNATRCGWHLREIDLRFSPGLPPGWYLCAVLQQQLNHHAVAVLRGHVEDGVAILANHLLHVAPLLAQQYLQKRRACCSAHRMLRRERLWPAACFSQSGISSARNGGRANGTVQSSVLCRRNDERGARAQTSTILTLPSSTNVRSMHECSFLLACARCAERRGGEAPPHPWPLASPPRPLPLQGSAQSMPSVHEKDFEKSAPILKGPGLGAISAMPTGTCLPSADQLLPHSREMKAGEEKPEMVSPTTTKRNPCYNPALEGGVSRC